jgi:hypothetical protein
MNAFKLVFQVTCYFLKPTTGYPDFKTGLFPTLAVLATMLTFNIDGNPVGGVTIPIFILF